MGNAAGFLTQLRREHLLHVCLTAEIGDLRLSRKEGIGTGCADCDLILHLVCGLKDDVGALVGDERCLKVFLTQGVVDVHHHAVLWRSGIYLRDSAVIRVKLACNAGISDESRLCKMLSNCWGQESLRS